jgi:hypothetical protein
MRNFRIGRLEIRLADYFKYRALHKAISQQPDVPDIDHEPVTMEQGRQAREWLRVHSSIKDFDAFEREVAKEFRETSSFLYPLFRWHSPTNG